MKGNGNMCRLLLSSSEQSVSCSSFVLLKAGLSWLIRKGSVIRRLLVLR